MFTCTSMAGPLDDLLVCQETGRSGLCGADRTRNASQTARAVLSFSSSQWMEEVLHVSIRLYNPHSLQVCLGETCKQLSNETS
jgi:hypothetical protein